MAEPRALDGPLQWSIAHQHVSAALVFALFVFVYLAPVLVGGDVLSPGGALYQFPPWAASQPPDLANYVNFILGDVPMSHYPLNVLARDFVHDGVFPAWSNHAYAGGPFFANPQTVLLSPFSLPMWIFSVDYGIAVAGALKLWFAAFGTYLLVRELRLGFWPGILAGVSYGLSAFSVLWLGHETLLSVAVMLPWMVWLIERILVTGRPAPAVGLTVVTAVMLTGGHPGAMVHVGLAAVLYTLVRAGTVADVLARQRLERGGLAFGGLALGVLLVAVLLVPVVEAGRGTIGEQARIGENPTIPGAELPFGTIRTALFPDWWGRPSALSMDGPANYNERTFFAGGVATIFAVIALVSAGAWRRKAPFAVLAFIGLAVPLHVPFVYWLAKHVPPIDRVQHQRMMVLWVFGIAVLGAFGLQRVLEGARKGGDAETAPLWQRHGRTLAVLAAAALVGVVALAGAGVGAADVGKGIENLLRFRHPTGDLLGGPANEGLKISTSVVQWLVVVALVAALLAALWRWPRRWPAIAAAIALLAAVDVLYFAHEYQPMAPAEKVHPPRTAALSYLARHTGEGRMTGVDGAALNDWPAIYGLQDLRGTNPPQPDLRWYAMWQVVYPPQLDWSQTMMSLPDQAGLNVLSVMGGRFIVTAPDVAARRRLPSLRRGYAGSDAVVWINPAAVPRALVAGQVLVSPGEPQTIGTIADPRFDPRRQVVIERDAPGAERLAGGGATTPAGRVRIADEANSTVTLRAQMRRRGLVVLNDRLTEGWGVEVDGRRADVIRVNGVMRGVAVPAGEHEIVWHYTVPGLRTGTILSGIGLLGLLSACGLLLVARRRRRAPRPPAAPAA
jgi:membrane protein YfhO